jgi:hypothetical protein
LPPIDPTLYRRLSDDILRRGILVPILQTEDGEILDGKLRLAIAEEHDLFCPRILVAKLSPEERADRPPASPTLRRSCPWVLATLRPLVYLGRPNL